MKPFLLGFVEQNRFFCIFGRNFVNGKWVEFVWRGSYEGHDNRCTVLLLRWTAKTGGRSLYEGEGDMRIMPRPHLLYK